MALHFEVNYPQEDQNYKIAFLCFFLVDSGIKRSHLQYRRIQENEVKEQDLNTTLELHADIHFLFISISNLLKMVQQLGGYYSDDSELKDIVAKANSRFSVAKDVRDDLEHFDHNRIEGKNRVGNMLDEPNALGVLKNGVYNFGGRRVVLKSLLEDIDSFAVELSDWNNSSKKFPTFFV